MPNRSARRISVPATPAAPVVYSRRLDTSRPSRSATSRMPPKWIGAPAERLTPCLAMSRAAASGFHASMAMVSPERHIMRRMPSVPAMCPAGKTANVVWSASVLRSASIARSSPSSEPWVCWTPLGSAVVPDVYTSTARPSGSGRHGVKPVAAVDVSSSSGMAPLCGPPSTTRCCRSGRSANAATVAPVSRLRSSRASTMARALDCLAMKATSAGP